MSDYKELSAIWVPSDTDRVEGKDETDALIQMPIPECPPPDTLSLGTTLEADLRGPLQGTVPLGPTKPPESCPLPDTIPIGTSQGYSLLHALSLMPSPAQPLLHTLLQETTQSQLSPLDPQQILWRLESHSFLDTIPMETSQGCSLLWIHTGSN